MAVLPIEIGGCTEKSANRHKENSVTVSSFKKAYKKTQQGIGGNHVESQDWRKDEVDVLLESTLVSERSQWDQRDSTYKASIKKVSRNF